MKPLSQMTRDELWSLDAKSAFALAHENNIDLVYTGHSGFPTVMTADMVYKTLDTLRLELQQDNADSMQDR